MLADQNPPRFLIAAKPVDGTPLTLLHWRRHDPEPNGKRGARFALMTHDGKSVWSLDLPDDYESGGDENSNARTAGFRTTSRRHPRIRPVRPVRSLVRQRRPACDVQSRPHVKRPVGRRRGRAAPSSRPRILCSSLPAIPPRVRQTGRFVLTSPRSAPATEVRDVRDFVFDSQGRIAFLRRSENASLRSPWSINKES